MKTKVSLPNLSHHSHYLIGSSDLRVDLKTILEDVHDIVVHGNPDFFDLVYTTYTIHDARDLKTLHETRPVHESGKKIFILSMDEITIEAQNALLKLLEEPAEYAYFFIIIPSAHLLLPTVKSRLVMIEVAPRSQVSSVEGEAFIRLPVAKRLDVIKILLEDISKEKKTKQDAIHFIDEVESAIYIKKGIKEGRKALETIDMARKYIGDRAPSLKMILESVALNC